MVWGGSGIFPLRPLMNLLPLMLLHRAPIVELKISIRPPLIPANPFSLVGNPQTTSVLLCT